jgi:polyhydroxybutyrate depolymerase
MNQTIFVCARFSVIALAVGLIGDSFALAQNKGKAQQVPKDLKIHNWTVDGVERVGLQYIPASATVKPTPVIIVFHGHGGLAGDAAREFAMQKAWPSAIVIYPRGLPTPAGNDPEGKETGWQYNPGEQNDRDVKLFDVIMEELRGSFMVDDKRVYAVGFSNGGGFTYVLWSMRGDQLAAIGSASMIAPEKLIATGQPKPMVLIAGKKDSMQPPSKVKKTVDAVVKLNECAAGQAQRKPGCTLFPSESGNPVLFYVHGGHHEVPRDASAVIVGFFKNQPMK